MILSKLLVIFNDGSEKVIIGVSDWGLNIDSGCFYFSKNNYKAFLPKENIKYFGREWDWSDGGLA